MTRRGKRRRTDLQAVPLTRRDAPPFLEAHVGGVAGFGGSLDRLLALTAILNAGLGDRVRSVP